MESSKPPDEIAALDDYFTNRTKQLISHPRSALLVQLVHVDGVVLDGGMDLDGNGDKAEGENTASENPSHCEQVNSPPPFALALTTEYIFR